MPIELPRGLPFAVDTWTPASAAKRHRFLTHAHRDHLAGITAATDLTAVYASRLTIAIARHILHRAAFVELEPGSPLLVHDPDGDFTVTAFDANHCPGAVMFLFDGASFGRVLHTGDCRLLLLLADYVFLDCTFAACSLQFPTKNDSIRQVGEVPCSSQENLRKLYRSMNVPVPRPLPSLVDLMGASKRPRVSPVVQLHCNNDAIDIEMLVRNEGSVWSEANSEWRPRSPIMLTVQNAVSNDGLLELNL